MFPFKLKPAFKDYIWGGDKLKKFYNKNTDIEPVAESWELSSHPDGMGVIANGEFSGMAFGDFIKKYPNSVYKGFNSEKDFPVLIKFIDAKENLSVQVHPDDEFAKIYENGQGKTEMWYVLDCEPGAFLYFGFRYAIPPEEFERRIQQKNITDVLRKVYVKKGDVFFIESGTIHAIGKGIVIAEIQQNSNTTYRVYDYGRTGKDGKQRELHIEKAKMVTKLNRASLYELFDFEHTETEIFSEKVLAKCKFFKVKYFLLNGEISLLNLQKVFLSYLCISGNSTLKYKDDVIMQIQKGDSVFIPADCPEGITLFGNCEFIITTV